MSKPFFSVFATLSLNKNLHTVMEQVTVERVSATKSGNYLRIYLRSEHLISKEKLVLVEEEIAKQLFPKKDIIIKIYDSYELSKQYNLKNLFDEYYESILWEFKNYNHIHHLLLKKAEIEFLSDTKLKLTVEDTALNKGVVNEVVRILDKIIHDRCGLPVEILVDYKDAKESRYAKESQIKVDKQVDEILSRIDFSKDEEEGSAPSESKQQPAAETAGTAAPSTYKKEKTDGNKCSGKLVDNKQSEYRRAPKKSDNPDR